ncbi:MAG TPA: AI-2E family transporter [Dermatophilaceae bacterium]|nr:AI-2E family transporter [Dermatophilaceae bacterium]
MAPAANGTPHYAPGDVRRPAEWSVPMGVRTASEWAWRAIVIGVVLYAVLWLLGFLSEIVVPVVIAALLCALLQPITGALSRVMPRGAAAGVTLVGTIALVSGMLSFVGTQFLDQFSGIRDQVLQGYDEVRAWLRGVGVSDNQLDRWVTQAREQLSEGGGLGQTAAQAGLTATHLIAGFFIVLFSLFFFLYDGRSIWAWLVRLFPRGARARVHSSGLVAWSQLSAFTRATVVVAAVDALGIGIGAAVLGVPFASGIGVLVFFGAFIPLIGATLSGAVAVLLALVSLGPISALIMLGIIIAVQQLEAHVLQPFLLGRAVRVHPLSIILAIAAGVAVAGIVGALIAVPLVAMLNAVGHHLLDTEEEDPQRADDLLTPPELAEVEAGVAEEQRIEQRQVQDAAAVPELARPAAGEPPA